MKKVLLDTDIFSEILKGKNSNVLKMAVSYQEIFRSFTVSTITILEIIKGLHKVQREKQVQKFLNQVPNIEVLSLEINDSILAGRIYADLERTGQTIGRADPIVAGTALHNKLTLVTGNIKHYQRIQKLGYDLILENWKD